MTDSINPTTRPTLEGLALVPANDVERAQAIEQAFDYRGDVTLVTADGQSYEGYLFDRRKDGPTAQIRMILKDDGRRVSVAQASIAKIVFSGRDTALGKSWETWLKKWAEKKAKGEAANIESEML